MVYFFRKNHHKMTIHRCQRIQILHKKLVMNSLLQNLLNQMQTFQKLLSKPKAFGAKDSRRTISVTR